MYLIFATTSELYLKIAILYVKIPDTKHSLIQNKSGHVFYGMC